MPIQNIDRTTVYPDGIGDDLNTITLKINDNNADFQAQIDAKASTSALTAAIQGILTGTNTFSGTNTFTGAVNGVQEAQNLVANGGTEHWIRIAQIAVSSTQNATIAIDVNNGGIGSRRNVRDFVTFSARSQTGITVLTQALADAMIAHVRIGLNDALSNAARYGVTIAQTDGSGVATHFNFYIRRGQFNTGMNIAPMNQSGGNYYGRDIAANTVTSEPAGIFYATVNNVAWQASLDVMNSASARKYSSGSTTSPRNVSAEEFALAGAGPTASDIGTANIATVSGVGTVVQNTSTTPINPRSKAYLVRRPGATYRVTVRVRALTANAAVIVRSYAFDTALAGAAFSDGPIVSVAPAEGWRDLTWQFTDPFTTTPDRVYISALASLTAGSGGSVQMSQLWIEDVTDVAPVATMVGFKNMLINCGVPINQRVFVGGALASGVYGYDRWKAAASGTNHTVAADGTHTLASGAIMQVIEAPEDAWGKPLTFSVEDPSNTITVNVGNVSGTIAAGSGRRGLTLTPTGSGNMTVQISVAGTRTFKRPQLERGAFATAFDARPIAVELELCQRYFLLWRPFGGLNFPAYANGAAESKHWSLPTTMRANPAVGSDYASWTKNAVASADFSATKDGLTLTVIASAVSSNVYIVVPTNGYIYLDAEL